MTGPDSLPRPQQNNFYTLIPHFSEVRFLLLPGEGGWTLPVYHPAERHTAQVEPLNITVREYLGLDVTTLLCAHLDVDRTGKGDANALFVM